MSDNTLRFRPTISFPRDTVSFDALRDAAKSDPNDFMFKAQTLIDKGELRFNKIRNLGAFQRAMGDLTVPFVYPGYEQFAVTTGAFQLLTGGMAVAQIQSAYDEVEDPTGALVTELEDMSRYTIVPRIVGLDNHVDNVPEAQEFPEVGASEDHVVIGSNRNGRQFTITQEAVEQNRIGDIIARANQIGRFCKTSIVKLTLNRVCDANGSADSPAAPYVYKPNGTGTQLYNHTANYPGTRAPSGTRVRTNAFVDETDLEAARAVLDAMLDDNGVPIPCDLSQCVLLCGHNLAPKVWHVTKSEMTSGVANEVNAYGPNGIPGFRPAAVISTAWLDHMAVDAWYLGNFKAQFTRKTSLPIEYVTVSNDPLEYLKTRIAFRARVAWGVEVGALDYVYVVQSLPATTAPTALA